MKLVHTGGRWFALLLTLWSVPVDAQSPNDTFLATLGELREASYSDKAAIVDRLSQTGHSSLSAVLTAFLEGRLYYRNDNQQIFVVKSADGDPLQLVNPLTLAYAGTAAADTLTLRLIAGVLPM